MTKLANNIVVVGLGVTGLSVVRFLQKNYPESQIQVIDTRDAPAGKDELPAEVKLHTGGWNLTWLLNADLIISNPGIALATPELQQASAKGIPIIGDIELFARHVTAPVVGITGSNGKSTVTSLVGEMAKSAHIDVGVGGNIGVPALDLLAHDHQLYILELSSFQLETTSSLKMVAATFLNFSEDHLDRYAGMKEYQSAKLRIFAHSQLALVNADDPQTFALNHQQQVSFGFTNADYCVKFIEGEEWLCAKGEPVIAAREICLVGRHNIVNCLAAMALADSADIARDAQIAAMKSYQGLAHRCQRVTKFKEVVWVNDSKATNPASTIAALDGLQLKGKLHLLLGGDGKGADFTDLIPVLNKLDVQLYCFGKDAKAVALQANAIIVADMQQAMQLAANNAKAGDMVLLSPACASLDQFTNFMQRGDIFASFALGLASEFAHGY